MRLLTKVEACRELRLSLSTLNRRIAAGKVPVRREPRVRRHRVYMMPDGDPPENVEAPASGAGSGPGACARVGRSSLSWSGSATPNWPKT